VQGGRILRRALQAASPGGHLQMRRHQAVPWHPPWTTWRYGMSTRKKRAPMEALMTARHGTQLGGARVAGWAVTRLSGAGVA
jgi:hypothetical protein